MIEIGSGTQGTGSGAFTLYMSKKEQAEKLQAESSARVPRPSQFGPEGFQARCSIPACRSKFLVNVFNPKMAEQFNFLDVSRSRKNIRVIIVPTPSTGTSPLIRQRPRNEIIPFNWPNKKADKELGGYFGEAADESNDTYFSVLKQVVDEQLAPFKKSVIDLRRLGDSEDDGDSLRFAVTLAPP
ncbi:hypothetical protein B0H66DRAFT_538282 [Apodospora peruviana]|uniref:Uncharacterized protein n=1 Tax=Apodospora peruviana TaxID=516989 RepID=A0AAE0HUM9_9PEZI|nr:hypothetical protein B0H66DRAFT_538282 [Apodospora peruviana]